MTERKNIFAIIGSASPYSANQKLVEEMGRLTKKDFDLTIFNDLKTLPHFDPEQSAKNPPARIIEFRNAIEKTDGVIIGTPEYFFSIPSGLKNALEWCISTTIFNEKPMGLITASANGLKGNEELQLIIKTAMPKFTDETTLLFQGIKGKFDNQGDLIDTVTIERLNNFIDSFKNLLYHHIR